MQYQINTTFSLEKKKKKIDIPFLYTMLQSVTVTCMDITAVFLVENALNQSNVIMSTGPV